ncbi:MAG: glycoside hydrolase family 3 N-terminal domain-containing protein [bacterium]
MKKEHINIELLSIRKLSAQVVFPRISAEEYYKDKEYQQSIHKLVEEGIGGFCVFQGNMGNVKSMITVLQSLAEIPLLFCADYEFGLPMRLENGTAFPQAMALGKSGNPEHTLKCSEAIAKEAKSIGVNWNLAPVCDINSNPNNPIINIRSFGDNLNIVQNHLSEYIRGHHNQNVLTCAKHFPGHGDTDKDSHSELPVLKHDKKRINDLELKPFIHAIQNDVKSIMVGHLSVSSLDESGIPASLSRKIITELLREELKYNGLILTDALDMKSLATLFSEEEIIIKAFNAGNDILLLPENPLYAIDILEKYIDNHSELKEQLFSSVNRILDAKEWCGLFDRKSVEIEISFFEHEKIALSAAYDALEILGDEHLIPLNEKFRVGGFAFLQTDDLDIPTSFFRILGQAIENDCDFGFIDKDIQEKDLAGLKFGIQKADIMLFAFFFKPSAYQSMKVPDGIMHAYQKLSEGKKKIAILFGNPYLKESIDADLIISPFSDSLPSIAATILKLSGRKMDF